MRARHGYIMIMIFALFMISACVSSVSEQGSAPSNAADLKSGTPRLDGSELVPSEGLTTRVLAPGQCGLFLFTQAETPKLIFFYSADAETASFHDGQAEYDLLLEAADGEIFGQFFSHMELSAPDGRTISIAYEAGEELEGGARIKNGRITVNDTQGWEIIMPVAGVRACQPQTKAAIL